MKGNSDSSLDKPPLVVRIIFWELYPRANRFNELRLSDQGEETYLLMKVYGGCQAIPDYIIQICKIH